jgi:hypothetical protein
MYVAYNIDHIHSFYRPHTSIFQCTKKVKFTYKCVRREYLIELIMHYLGQSAGQLITTTLNVRENAVSKTILQIIIHSP